MRSTGVRDDCGLEDTDDIPSLFGLSPLICTFPATFLTSPRGLQAGGRFYKRA